MEENQFRGFKKILITRMKDALYKEIAYIRVWFSLTDHQVFELKEIIGG